MSLLKVEVVFASATHYQILPVQVRVGSTIREVIQQSGVLDIFPEIHAENAVGIFGKQKNYEDKVEAGDRVEIYRDLHQSAMDSRRNIAQQNKRSRWS